MKHKVRVTAEWWVTVDIHNEDDGQDYADEICEEAIEAVINDDDSFNDAEWDAELIDEDGEVLIEEESE